MSAWETGDRDNPICIVGEAPSYVEIKQGLPFAGPSGDVLNDCLHAAGLSRRHCYVINAFPFRVEKNKTDDILRNGELLWNAKKGFTEEGHRLAAPSLDRIKACGANVVVPMGRVAMDLVLGDHRPLLKWRGSTIWSDLIGKKILPTIHPAATIHGVYVWRHIITNDLGKVAQHEMSSPKLDLPKRDIIVSPTLADVLHYMRSCKEAKKFATDLEVMNHQVYCFSLAYKHDEAMTVPLVAKDGSHYFDEDDEIIVWKAYNALMIDPDIMKVNQNLVGFDSVFLFDKMNIHLKGRLGDPMIAQHIIYPEEGFRKGLDFIASYHTREPYWKDEGKIWKKMEFDWVTFQKYCGKDAAVALEAWDVLSGELTSGGYWPTYDMTIELAEPIAYMTVRGLAVDSEGLRHTNTVLTQAIVDLEKQLADVAQYPFNAISPMQCRKYFYEDLGIKPYKNAQGGVTTDDKAMARIARQAIKGSAEAKIVQEIRKLTKLQGTYVEVELDPDSRLRCSWNPRGTWTGRLSSSQTIFGTGLNLQNLHPKFKGFIVAG